MSEPVNTGLMSHQYIGHYKDGTLGLKSHPKDSERN